MPKLQGRAIVLLPYFHNLNNVRSIYAGLLVSAFCKATCKMLVGLQLSKDKEGSSLISETRAKDTNKHCKELPNPTWPRRVGKLAAL